MTPDVRHQARAAALQALYLWEIGRVTPDDALAAFWAEHELEADDAFRGFAAALVRGVATGVADLDRVITEHTRNWRIERLAIIDRLILRMGVWELQQAGAPAVVINEAIELARAYGTDESPRFVNGVLDAVRKALEGPGPKAEGQGEAQ